MALRQQRPGPSALISAVRSLAGVGLLLSATHAGATAYRCDDAGRVTYTNLPCASGKQSEVVPAPLPSAADRADAIRRNKADLARLAEIERNREAARKQDARLATLALRRNPDRGKRAPDCSKLALYAKRAREDIETAGPRDQPAKLIKARRATEDYALSCVRR